MQKSIRTPRKCFSYGVLIDSYVHIDVRTIILYKDLLLI